MARPRKQQETMSFNDRVNKIKQYLSRIEVIDGVLIVRVNFKPKWQVMQNKDKDFPIRITKDSSQPNQYLYFGANESITMDDVFDYIQKTIDFNEAIEKKITILMQKIEELKEIFSNESDIKALEKLKFVYKASNKPRRQKKTEESINESTNEVKEEETAKNEENKEEKE